MSKRIQSTVLLAAAFALAGLTAACDPAEQDRTLRYQKGTYLGEADTALTQEQLNELRQRSRLQSAN